MTPAAFTLACKQVSAEHQGKATSLAESFFGVGSMFGPTIGGWLFDLGGFPLPFWIFGGFSLFLSLSSFLLLTDSTDVHDEVEQGKDVTWSQVLSSPGVLVSLVSMVCAGTGWQWYAPSLDPYMEQTFGLSASQTGLVFMSFGITYTVFTPLFGYLTDQGLDGMSSMIIGNSCILITFIFLAPIPPLSPYIGPSLPGSVVSMALQGLGSAATYIGSLLYMLRGVSEAGLPDTDQTKGET